MTKKIRTGLLALGLAVAIQPVAHGRDLTEILEEKGVVSAEEAAEAREPEKGSAFDFRAFWKDRPYFETADKRFSVGLGGRVQNDWAYVDPDGDTTDERDVDDTSTGTEFRRARLEMDGTMYGRVIFKFQYDFAEGDADFNDVYLGLTRIPYVGTLRVGNLKEPFSLEEQASTRFTTFMERSLPNMGSSARSTGIMAHNAVLDGRLWWGLGGFRETDSFGDGYGTDSEYNLSVRVSGLPLYEEEGRHLLHLGFSYSHQFRNDDKVRYRQRPESHLADYLVDTGNIQTDGVDILNPEFAFQWGPGSLQAEYYHGIVDTVSGKNLDLWGYYVYASYFITGEYRPYKTKDAAFDAVTPQRNFLEDGGCGAWEAALRYSRLDLDSHAVEGGILGDITAGVNWYLYKNLRVSTNYVFAHLEGVGDTHVLQARFQIYI